MPWNSNGITPKTQILEAYLNLAPYGRNIEGVGAASEIYFGKTAARLSEPEAIALSVIPQSPTRRALVVGHENAALMAAQKRWSTRAGGHEARELSRDMFSAEARSRSEFVSTAFCSKRAREQNRRPRNQHHAGSSLQKILERRVTDYIAQNRQRGIENAAALLIDFRSMEVLAQVGSADFTNAQIHGQVDGTRRPRSPGSTLKPFVYALALDQGRIHPLTLLKDAPRSFRRLQSGEFRSRISRSDSRVRRARAQPECSRGHARLGVVASEPLRIPAQRGCRVAASRHRITDSRCRSAALK